MQTSQMNSTEHVIIKDAIHTVRKTLINVLLSVVNSVTGEGTSGHPSLWLDIPYHTPCTGC